MSTIIVGVDGSAESEEALEIAFDEARRRGSKVKVVNAWHISLRTVCESKWADIPIDRDLCQRMAQALVDRMIEEAGSAAGIGVTTVVREGQAADVICEEAKGADLLVVGSRGRGRFRNLLLGSVSRRCCHDASCPVLVVSKRIAEPGGNDGPPSWRGYRSSRAALVP